MDFNERIMNLGIAFVKINDDELADEYNLKTLPSKKEKMSGFFSSNFTIWKIFTLP